MLVDHDKSDTDNKTQHQEPDENIKISGTGKTRVLSITPIATGATTLSGVITDNSSGETVNGVLEVTVLSRSEARRNIVNLTFESPEHTVGSFPTIGFFPDLVNGFSYPKTVVAASGGNMVTQSLKLNAGGSFQQYIGVSSDEYYVSFDVKTENLQPTTNTIIMFDWAGGTTNRVYFTPEGEITFNNQLMGNFTDGTAIHIDAHIIFDTMQIIFKIDGGNELTFSLDPETIDLHSLRFYQWTGDDIYIYMDNIVVDAMLYDDHPFPAPNNEGKYIMDFDGDDITNTSDPHKENGFSLRLAVPRTAGESAGSTSLPNSGSNSVGFTYNSYPTLYHQHGYTFSLHEIDLAQYSSSVNRATDVVFTGYRKDGSSITKAISKDNFTMAFYTETFNSNWSNLFYVEFSDAISVDNIVLSVDDAVVGF